MKPPAVTPRMAPATAALILLPIGLLVLMFLAHPYELQLQTLVCITPRKSESVNLIGAVTVKPDFRLFIGILTIPDGYDRRSLVRMTYLRQQPVANAIIDVKFVFCNLTTEEQRVLIALEILVYDDIIILNCKENMDSGKTYTFFSSLPAIFNGTNGGERPYEFVLKTDDDMYWRLPQLVESLKGMPRDDFYYGVEVPPNRHYMSGMGYLISWDLVEWISTSEIARNHTSGYEDMVTGSWFNDAGKAKNRYYTQPLMHDYPGRPTGRDAPLTPASIAVHKLKDNLQWARTLAYFNVTAGLKPSKLYHID